MQKLARLAHLLDIKYGFHSQAAILAVHEERIMAEVKRDILDAYRNYFSRTAKDSMFQYAADLGETKSAQVVEEMDKLVGSLDKLSPQKIMDSLNEVLGLIFQIKNDPSKSARQTIHDSISGSSETQRNIRQRLLSKYERSMSVSFSMLKKIATKLQVIISDPVYEGRVDRQRSDLSKQQLLDFVLGNPSFRSQGIDSLDVIEQFLADPDAKEKLITLINAVNRGEVPLNSLAISQFATYIKEWLNNKR